MDGLLVVDKPSGPTSHDVVARLRRLLREKRIGHTGTLDPMASGVLPLVIGRATRLARFMSSDEKRYDAVVRLGFSTDTGDSLGDVAGERWNGPWPDRATVHRALDPFRGTFLQQPPAYSAKKIDGERSYRLARKAKRETDAVLVLPEPAEVTAFALEIADIEGDLLSLAVTCSSGFYVRSLAHDLGRVLGVGGHLTTLRRTATSGVTLTDAVTLDELEGGRRAPASALVPMDQLVPHLQTLQLNDSGADKASHGQDLGPSDVLSGFPAQSATPGPFRLIDASGALMGIAERSGRPGLLHPAVILR